MENNNTNDLVINIDYREKALIDIFRKNKNETELLEEINKNLKPKEKINSVKYTIENLLLGDINIKFNDELILIIERKSLKDLISSVKDGRYKEQKARIQSSGVRAIYIIEELYSIPVDKLNLDIYGMKVKQLFGLIMNAMFRDNIQMLFTKNVEDTCLKTQMVIKKYKYFVKEKPENIEILSQENEEEKKILEYVDTIKIKKKDNMNGKICYLHQLCAIPGLSSNIANIICQTYPSWYSLCNGYNDVEESKRKFLLKDLNIPISNNKSRKLGKVLSEKVYNNIFSINAMEN
jgi:ERCC4-type nuclease